MNMNSLKFNFICCPRFALLLLLIGIGPSSAANEYTFTYVGLGICVDSNMNHFDYVKIKQASNPEDCKLLCTQCPGNAQIDNVELIGFDHGNGVCTCHIKNGAGFNTPSIVSNAKDGACSDALGDAWVHEAHSGFSGVGEITVTGNLNSGNGYVCYRADLVTAASPTNAPTGSPTNAPTNAPTESPTNAPTESPTNAPTNAPTESPTANPTPAIPSWIVQHESTIANFNETNDEEEITLVYTIGKNRVARPTLYKEGCEIPLDVDENSDSFDGISLGADPTPSDIEGDPHNSKYEVFLNVVKNATVLDDLLSKNGTLLSFCSKVALLGSDGTTEIKKNETNIAITLNFTNTFSVDDISLKQIYVGQDNVTTNVLQYVEACACADGESEEGRQCITDPPAITGDGNDDKVKVCVSSKSPEMEIASLDRLYLQGNGDEVLEIVEDGNWEPGMASVVYPAAEVWNGVFAAGVVPTSYYSYQGDVSVTVTGTVILKLAGSRRRIAVEIGHEDKSEEVLVGAAGGSSRALQSAEDQQKSAFAVNFALQKRSELELSDADVNGATGASVSGFGFAATTGIISSVIAAIMVWWE